MLELPTDEGVRESFGLNPDARVTRKGHGAGPPALVAAVDITRPLITPITKELIGDNAELLAFWKAERKTFRYDYVSFRCTFHPDADQPFEKAWLEVQLKPDGDGGAIAYSMSPDQVVDVTKVTEGAKIGSDLKLVKAEVDEKVEKNFTDFVLRAWKEHTAKPYWELRKTETTSLAGTFKFHLITRMPVKAKGSGRLTASAQISKTTFWIFRTKQAAGDPATLDFSISGAGKAAAKD